LLLAPPRITDDPARVRAMGVGRYSLDVELFAYVDTADWNDFLAVQEDVLMRIMELVNRSGTAFAFPSRTVCHARDPGLSRERQQAAEQQVRD
jgi:MscS family membrane protein